MSADLLAEFDSFYQAPQDGKSNSTPASNDLSLLSDTGSKTQARNGANFTQWQGAAANTNDDIWGLPSGFPSALSTQSGKTSQDSLWDSSEGFHYQTREQNGSQPGYGGFAKGGQKTTAQNKASIARRPTLDLFSSDIYEASGNVTTKDHNIPKPVRRTDPPLYPVPDTKSSYEEVLFDADEMAEPEENDDFGDFETGHSEPALQPYPTQLLTYTFGATTLAPESNRKSTNPLLPSATFGGSNLPYPQAPKSPSFRERNPFAELGIATKEVSEPKSEAKFDSASPISAWPTYEPKVPKTKAYIDSPAPNNADDEWGDFADLIPDSTPVQVVKAVSGIETGVWGWGAADHASDHAPAPAPIPAGEAPPTNIPPPSVMLALFPVLFDLPQSTLFKPVANHPYSLKNRIISDPATIDFLRGYLIIATVAARIIAGRKLRWKRDTLLSQAMKIGPAPTGGKGGMKLMGVDKAEITREDREAADVVRVWREQLGRLRSAIAVANSSMADTSAHLAIPDISDNLYVKAQEGGLIAPKPCIICGLKREERVNKVDVRVEDSFGEWWIEHWGHRACRNFWLEHEPRFKVR